MAKKKSFSIGKSLSEALTDTVTAAASFRGELHIESLPLRKIALDPDNPRDLALTIEEAQQGVSSTDSQYKRKLKERESLKSLSQSILEQGIINPVVVFKHGENYRLVAGERRTLATAMSHLDNIPAKILAEKPSAIKLSVLQWVENMERKDLSLWERMRNIKKILNAYCSHENKALKSITASEISQLLGCSVQQATNYKNVLFAPPAIQSLIQNNAIANIEKVALLVTCKPELQQQLIEECLKGATLTKLHALHKSLKKSFSQPNLPHKRGRQATRVNFGSTTNMEVAKVVIQTLLDSKQVTQSALNAQQINWNDYKSVTQAFQTIIKSLERVTI